MALGDWDSKLFTPSFGEFETLFSEPESSSQLEGLKMTLSFDEPLLFPPLLEEGVESLWLVAPVLIESLLLILALLMSFRGGDFPGETTLCNADRLV